MVLKVVDKFNGKEWSVTNVYVDPHFTNIEITNIENTQTIEYKHFYDYFEVPEEVSKYIAKSAFKQLGGRVC